MFTYFKTSHAMRKIVFVLLGCILIVIAPAFSQTQGYAVRGKVIDRLTRQGVPYANVMIEGKAGVGAATDSTGVFLIPKVAPGICRLIVSCLGYKGTVSSEYMISAGTPLIEIELAEDSNALMKSP